MNVLLAYRPFLDPIDLQGSWYLLLIPLAFLISLVYKAVRLDDLKRLPRQAMVMTVQVIGAMVGLGAGFYLFVEYVLPRIAA